MRLADPGDASADPLEGFVLVIGPQSPKSQIREADRLNRWVFKPRREIRARNKAEQGLPTELGDQTGPPGPTINKNNIKLGPKKQTSFLHVQIVK